MGYESKLYICKRIKIGEGLIYNEMLAAMNMSKMGSDMDNTDEFPYWRIAVLQEMLGSFYNLFKPIGNEQLIVVHYGY